MQFEPTLRSNIMAAARDMGTGGTRFATFRTSFCNRDYWILTNDGGFLLRGGVTPAQGIRDIFSNGRKYGFECATAIIILFYKGVLDTIGDGPFNELFPNLFLHSWQADSDLGVTTEDVDSQFARPGDALYFRNPEVNPVKMEWQGENVIKMGDDLYYGHGIGIKDSSGIIQALNKHRVPGATMSAYLENQATFPDYGYLSQYAPADIRATGYETRQIGAGSIRASIGGKNYVKA